MATVTVKRNPTSRYRPPVTARHAPPIPPHWLAPLQDWRPPPAMWQFVVLSMLLHALFIALFGAPSGGSREGRAMWGAMQVELRGLLIEPEAAPPAVAPLPPAQSESRELLPAPTRQDRGAAEGAVPMTPPADTQAAAAAPAGPAIVEVPTPFPRLLDRLPTREIPLAEPPALRVPPPTEGRDLRPPPRERPEPSTVEVPAPLPLTPAPTSERALAEPPAVALPLPQPLQPLPVPAQASPPLQEAPVPAPAARPAELPVPQPAELPVPQPAVIAVPPLESVAPRSEDPTTALELTPLPRIEAAPAPAPMQAAPQPTAPEVPAPATPETQLAPRVPAPSISPPGPRSAPGASRRGEASGEYDPTAPALDPEALRKRAARLAREGTGARALLPFAMPPVPEKKSTMEQAIENARKPDCSTAYQGLGLLAVVPLIANEIGEGSCRWRR